MSAKLDVDSQAPVAEKGPLVSVVIPVYNAERYLGECLGSVLGQSLRDIEVICVDDESTDSSAAILDEYARRDPRVVVLRQAKKDAGAARNKGLAIARGKYLSFLDADDTFDPRMLEGAVERADALDLDVVMFRTCRHYELTGKVEKCPWTIKADLLPEREVFSPRDVGRDFFMAMLGYTWDKLFRRAFVQEHRLSFQEQPVFNDSFFTYSALLTARRISVLDDYYVFQRKRIQQNSITDRRAAYYTCAVDLINGLHDFMQAHDCLGRYEQDLCNYAVHMLGIELKSKRKSDNYLDLLAYIEEQLLTRIDILNRDIDFYYDKIEAQAVIDEIESYRGRYQGPIPVVYAADDAYLRYVAVSIESMLSSKYCYTRYQFFILTPTLESSVASDSIVALVGRYDGCSVRFIDMGSRYADVKTSIAHITTPTYYRLSLPALLPDCDRCIYMDGDTIVCNDLNLLYRHPMGDAYVAGVRAYVYYRTKEEHAARLGIDPGAFEYVNAGVLLLRLDRMRESSFVEASAELLKNEYDSQDQDIINILCQSHIAILPWKYNVMTKYRKWGVDDFGALATPGEIVYGRRRPVVIHYADKVKPWSDPCSSYADEWWRHALAPECWPLVAQDGTEVIIDALRRRGRQVRAAESKADDYARSAERIRASATYKIGRAATFVPRQIRSLLRRGTSGEA